MYARHGREQAPVALDTIAIVPVIAPYRAGTLVKSISKTCRANVQNQRGVLPHPPVLSCWAVIRVLHYPFQCFKGVPIAPGRLDWFEAKILNTNIANYPKESVEASARYVNSYPSVIPAHTKLKPIFRSRIGILYHSVVPTATSILAWGAHNDVQYLTSSGADINGITKRTTMGSGLELLVLFILVHDLANRSIMHP